MGHCRLVFTYETLASCFHLWDIGKFVFTYGTFVVTYGKCVHLWQICLHLWQICSHLWQIFLSHLLSSDKGKDIAKSSLGVMIFQSLIKK